MPNLERVNLMLDPRQREELERVAKQKKRSVSELVREYITAGLREDNAGQRRLALFFNRPELQRTIVDVFTDVGYLYRALRINPAHQNSGGRLPRLYQPLFENKGRH